ncbi:MAG: T9SS type A sorting domain-containing protein [Balneolaceae bacterium]
MKIFNTILWAFIAILVFTGTSYSQETSVFALNYFEESEIVKAKDNPEGKSYYQLNDEIFDNPNLDRGAVLEIQKSDGNLDRLVILDREEYMTGTVSIRAYKEGNPQNLFIATYNKGSLNGIFYDKIDSPIHFGYDNTKHKNFISTKNERIEERLACNIDHSKELVAPSHFNRHNFGSKQKAVSQSSPAAPLIASEDDSVTIDLMIVYTQAAEDWALTSGFGDIAGVIAQSMNLSQTALNNSNTGIDIRLVNTTKTTYNEETDGVDSETRLSRFTQNPSNPVLDEEFNGFMEEIHGIRNTSGADVVSWFVKIEDTGGLGWRLDSSGGSPDFAFNLNRVQQVADTFTLIHEVGHNMGNAHSRTQSSSEASGGGGLFHYSVGFQNTTSNYHTVMAYSDNGQQEAPIFSSPNLTYLGTVTGENSSTTPSDNSRSLREIKRTVSNYRDTQVSSPTASLLADIINIEMNREENLNIPFQIFNDGESVLVWDIDFGFSGNAFKRSKNSGKEISPADLNGITKNAANYSKNESRMNKNILAEETLYSTSFENNEGFSTGTFEGISEWRAISDTDFIISSSNSNSGSQHLRIQGNGDGNTKFISAPFLGFQQFGSYEVKASFSISSTAETFDIYISDGKNGESSAGIIISGGTIFAANLDEQNEVSFFGTSANVTPNQYHEIKMTMDPDNEVIRYIFNGTTIAENSYLGGFNPGEMLFLSRNEVNGVTYDIDDVEVKKISAPYPWLSVSNSTGFTVEGASSSRSLQFTTVGVSPGTYRTKMLVRTNDPQKPVIDVPITLTVADQVSNEESEEPVKLALNQNYPNPFNPSTTISYTLENTGLVQLEVFNIQGQRVATLVNSKQQQGSHNVTFDASNLSSGIYMYRLQTASQTLTRQMVLIK